MLQIACKKVNALSWNGCLFTDKHFLWHETHEIINTFFNICCGSQVYYNQKKQEFNPKNKLISEYYTNKQA